MSRPPRVVGVTAAPHRPDALTAARYVGDGLAARGIEVRFDQPTAAALGLGATPAERFLAEGDLLVILGGDGTVVGAAREASHYGTPVVGINFGTFGFLTEIEADELEPALEAIVAGDFDIEERLMLDVSTDEDRPGTVASNDVAVTAAEKGRVLDLIVYADGHAICEYPADGLVIATPTGSTAYSLSAGGPVLAPTVDAFVLTPICPHSLSVRPLVVDADVTLRVQIGEVPRMSRWGTVSVDGQIPLDLAPGAALRVRRSERRMRLARLAPSMFFDSLRRKLRWGSR